MPILMKEILKEELRLLAILTRDRLDFKQRKMAEALVMSDTSYSEIEAGDFMCGTLTAVLLLIAQEDPNKFLQEFRSKLETAYAKKRIESRLEGLTACPAKSVLGYLVGKLTVKSDSKYFIVGINIGVRVLLVNRTVGLPYCAVGLGSHALVVKTKKPDRHF